MVAVRDGNPDAAYDLLAPELRDEVGQGNFRERFTSSALTDWKFTNFSITNDQGYVGGSATVSGNSFGVEFQFASRDGKWVIIGYDLRQLGSAGVAPVKPV
jgi:hypothetical protein